MFEPIMIGATVVDDMYQFTGCSDETYYMSLVDNDWRFYFDNKPDEPHSKYCDYTVKLSEEPDIESIIAEAKRFAEDVSIHHLSEYEYFSDALVRNYADYLRKQKIDNLLK